MEMFKIFGIWEIGKLGIKQILGQWDSGKKTRELPISKRPRPRRPRRPRNDHNHHDHDHDGHDDKKRRRRIWGRKENEFFNQEMRGREEEQILCGGFEFWKCLKFLKFGKLGNWELKKFWGLGQWDSGKKRNCQFRNSTIPMAHFPISLLPNVPQSQFQNFKIAKIFQFPNFTSSKFPKGPSVQMSPFPNSPTSPTSKFANFPNSKIV